MVFGEKKDKDPNQQEESGFIPDLVRRAVERSVQALLNTDEGAKNLVGALMPRELVHSVMQQIDGAKTDAVNMVGREMQAFLQSLNVGDELKKILTSVSFEIATTVRFIPNEDGTLSSDVTTRAKPVVHAKAAKAKKAGAKARKPRKAPVKSAATAAVPQGESTAQRVRNAANGTRKTMQRMVGGMVEAIGERASEIGGSVADMAAGGDDDEM